MVTICGAHPRVCGENGTNLERLLRWAGSSPRVRGKQTCSVSYTLVYRLIPACAGKTVSGGSCLACLGAHPRVCGENINVSGYSRAHVGSSPRVRGKLRSFRFCDLGHGLIPACAGKTMHGFVSVVKARAHPRVCGENVVALCGIHARAGSSPRVRGKR